MRNYFDSCDSSKLASLSPENESGLDWLAVITALDRKRLLGDLPVGLENFLGELMTHQRRERLPGLLMASVDQIAAATRYEAKTVAMYLSRLRARGLVEWLREDRIVYVTIAPLLVNPFLSPASLPQLRQIRDKLAVRLGQSRTRRQPSQRAREVQLVVMSYISAHCYNQAPWAPPDIAQDAPTLLRLYQCGQALSAALACCGHSSSRYARAKIYAELRGQVLQTQLNLRTYLQGSPAPALTAQPQSALYLPGSSERSRCTRQSGPSNDAHEPATSYDLPGVAVTASINDEPAWVRDGPHPNADETASELRRYDFCASMGEEEAAASRTETPKRAHPVEASPRALPPRALTPAPAVLSVPAQSASPAISATRQQHDETFMTPHDLAPPRAAPDAGEPASMADVLARTQAVLAAYRAQKAGVPPPQTSPKPQPSPQRLEVAPCGADSPLPPPTLRGSAAAAAEAQQPEILPARLGPDILPASRDTTALATGRSADGIGRLPEPQVAPTACSRVTSPSGINAQGVVYASVNPLEPFFEDWGERWELSMQGPDGPPDRTMPPYVGLDTWGDHIWTVAQFQAFLQRQGVDVPIMLSATQTRDLRRLLRHPVARCTLRDVVERTRCHKTWSVGLFVSWLFARRRMGKTEDGVFKGQYNPWAVYRDAVHECLDASDVDAPYVPSRPDRTFDDDIMRHAMQRPTFDARDMKQVLPAPGARLNGGEPTPPGQKREAR